ncbi:MAG: cobalamin B12-binding domain-containing protein [Chthoniobacteraceae bacterium]
MEESRFPLNIVVRRTGLSPQLIRAWESRHRAVAPTRTESRRRLYTSEDIARLSLMRQLTQLGHPISQIARLPFLELQRRLNDEPNAERAESKMAPDSTASATPENYVERGLLAAGNFDEEEMQRVFDAASVSLGRSAFLRQVIAPLAERIGVEWREGRLKVAHEHFATAQLRTLLGPTDRGPRASPNAPSLIVTTPTDQWHEMGALLVAAAAHSHGWRATFLGAALPAEDVAAAALSRKARAVALSIVYPENDPEVVRHLEHLRRLLPKSVAIIVGGRASESYLPTLEKIGASHLGDLQDLYVTLDCLQKTPPLN